MIIGHQKIQERLSRSIEKNVAVQSYLFIGPESVGKFDVAKEFAFRLIGEPDYETKRSDRQSVDFLVLEPEQETVKGVTKERDISADMTRESARFLGSSPYAGRKKVLIIRDAHRLTETAQNMLLKTLEEPPSYAVIILVTHDLERILPTILSRCQQVRFGLVGKDEMAAASRSHDALSDFNERNRFLLDLGRPGLAIRSCRQEADFSNRLDVLEKLMNLSSMPLRERLILSESCAANVPQTMDSLMWYVGGSHIRAMATSDDESVSRMRSIEKAEKLMRDMKRFPSSARLLLDTFFMHW